jgi:hypothetical protein
MVYETKTKINNLFFLISKKSSLHGSFNSSNEQNFNLIGGDFINNLYRTNDCC